MAAPVQTPVPAPVLKASLRQVSPVRERILRAASELFYRTGIRAVSADKIIAAAGITKVTFYRHFPSKDELVVAYLRDESAREHARIERLRAEHVGDPAAVFRAIAADLAAVSCSPNFRGCAWINAAAEYADPEHIVRQAVDEHRRWMTEVARELLDELGVPDAALVAGQLVMLRDGAMVAGYLGGSASVAHALLHAGRAIVDQRAQGSARIP
ncbi:TetR/AcrR family transcriptional regulator [Pengzhenrongella sp.]|jgi:AcrR family transcriptional regulator|uniref:TetR/AcrR family transcriptional regulator n=1 Tax=Pengzhenrongella sp. TaxID=2888820 RepID=UPI002F91D889